MTILAESSSAPVLPWRWSVEALLRVADLGIFGEDRIELLQGEIVTMPPPSPEHSGVINPVAGVLSAAFRAGFVVRTEQPAVLSRETLLLPDLVVCRGAYADYRRRYPVSEDIVLVVEVSLSTLEYDRTTKLAFYASSGIPEYWIMNLRYNQLEVYRGPMDNQYGLRQIFLVGQSVAPLSGSSSLTIDALFG